MQTFTLPTGLELQLQPLPNLMRLKLARQSQVSFKKPQEAKQNMQISILAEVVEAGVSLTLTEVQKVAAQVYRHEFEREKPGVITRTSDKFVYILAAMSDGGKWGELVDSIIELGPAPAAKNPLAFFKRSGKPKK